MRRFLHLLLLFMLCTQLCAGMCSEGEIGADALEVSSEDDAPASDAPFQLGTHPQRANQPSQWRLLDREIDVELGGQGSWMIVLGFRTRGVFTGEVEITGALSIPDRELGTLTLSGQKLLPGGDSFDYFYDFFLALDIFDISVHGQKATLTFSVTGNGERIEVEKTLELRGGP